jgi:hypothetical protein
MLNAVGGKYLRVAEALADKVLVQALLPRTLTVPPRKFWLKLMVMVALSGVEETTKAPVGSVQL